MLNEYDIHVTTEMLNDAIASVLEKPTKRDKTKLLSHMRKDPLALNMAIVDALADFYLDKEGKD